MNGPRIVASITAAGCLATGLFSQDRGRQQATPERESSNDRQMAPSGMSGMSSPVDRGSDQRGNGGGSDQRGNSGGGSDQRGNSGGSDQRGVGSGRTVGLSGRSTSPDRQTSSTTPGIHGVLASHVNTRVHGHEQYWQPCQFLPNSFFWSNRDIMAEIQFMSRQGFVACTLVADDALEVTDYSDFPQGWKGYAFVVPAKGTLHVSLNHANRGWFRLVMMDKWGDLQAGMLPNMIPTGNPEVTFKNPKDEAQAVYVVADDPGWMSSKAYPYQLTVQRSWEPGSIDFKNVKVAVGVWGNHQDNSAQFRRPTWVGFGSSSRGIGWW